MSEKYQFGSLVGGSASFRNVVAKIQPLASSDATVLISGETGTQVTARNSLAGLKYDYFLTKKLYLDSQALFEKDSFQNLLLRTTLGEGVGYQFLDAKITTLSGELGLSYIDERFSTAPGTRTPSTRWSIRFEHALWPERVRVSHRQDGFRDFMTRVAYRVNADTGIRITISENLFANIEYDYRFNSKPAPGKQESDETFIFGVGYSFGP